MFFNKNEIFSGEQEKRIHYSCEDGLEKAILMMPIGDPRDRFF